MSLRPPLTKYQRYDDYYDIFYCGKDYKRESSFLEKIFREYSKNSIHSILDLGCGMGGHALILSKKGYKVTGVDLSSKLIKLAQRRAKENNLKIDFFRGDIRKINLEEKFDAVIAMFNVVGFQVRDEDFRSVIKTASKHLKKNGLFVFDCWFGPAVVFQRPENWLKVFKRNRERMIKFTKSTLNKKNKVVYLDYKIFRIFGNKIKDEFNEKHTLRFFFPKEIKKFLKNRFRILEICPFLKLGKLPSKKDWNITVIAQKND
jgi:SAM-dependent methyltransferase